MLTFIAEAEKPRFGLYRCQCGAEKAIRNDHVNSGKVKSCGCFRRSLAKEKATKHGTLSHRGYTTEYTIWVNMKQRCLNPSNHAYADYGGAGITVCDRWIESFQSFLDDMGLRPSKDMSLDRIDNGKGYSPDNCRWATRSQQARNKRNTIMFNGISVRDLADRAGLRGQLVLKRLRSGWALDDALTTPVIPHNTRTGISRGLKVHEQDWARRNQLTPVTD